MPRVVGEASKAGAAYGGQGHSFSGREHNADGYTGHNGATISHDTTTASEGVASITRSPSRLEEKAMRLPSGDDKGAG